MSRQYKNYIVWRGHNPRLIDIVWSEYDPLIEDYPSAAGTWWELIREQYGNLINEPTEWQRMLVTSEEEVDWHLRDCGAIP